MTLKTCLEIGNDCGLETIGESIFNIDMHAMNIFDYSKITEEINKVVKEKDELFSKTNFTNDSKTEDVLAWIKLQDDGVNTEDLNL